MLTFSVNGQNDAGYLLRVKKAIDENIQYFKAFNGEHWEEAVHKAVITAINNRNDDYTNIVPYIKNLARNVLKTKRRENVYDIVTDDGEISYPFLSLITDIDERVFVDHKEINNAFKEMYLMYPEDFLKLRQLFTADTEAKFSKSEIIKNADIKNMVSKLTFKYSSHTVFYDLYAFLRNLDKATEHALNVEIRNVDMKVRPDSLIDQIPDIPLIKDSNGNLHGIDKVTLTMDIDPDYEKWDTVANTACDIMKIDISPLIDYMYNEVYVQEGVHTKHIVWCDDMYKLITPGGKEVVNLDRDKFMNLVRIEVILNLIASRFNTVIAVSPDSVYIKPTRTVPIRVVRLHLPCDKTIDLPITVHIKKRK